MYSKPFLFETRVISSLEKVFCAPGLSAGSIDAVSGAQGEHTAFQIACKSPASCEVAFEVESPLAEHIRIREVGLAPCLLPANPDDPHILTSLPGLFPDPLLPVKTLTLSKNNWHALWVDVRIPEQAEPGRVDAVVILKYPADKPVHEQRLRIAIDVLPFRLPKQKLINVNWFYADCLMAHYRVPTWSEAHWTLIERYFRNMTAHGNNAILTPLWSVPLDTAVGGERPTCQLLQIAFKDGVYAFDFSRLERWISLAKACGFEYFEMAHAYTQWGAKAAPKIMVTENGVETKKFGWDTDASSAEFRDFQRQLLSRLLPFLRAHGVTPENCFFHISDEPSLEMLESYRSAATFFNGLLDGYPVIDALSHVEFFRQGLIKRPVPVTNALDEFMKEKVEQRWTYYFGNWWDGVPNRQFGMPSARNRIHGVILYLYGVEGMLNWGYNFWFTQQSRDWHIDPFSMTDAGRAFCGGGAFMVYPGKDGQPVDSIHFEVYAHALQDIRALELLESLIGREETVKLIHEGLWHKITLKQYPRSAEWLLDMRDRVNRRIAEAMPADSGRRRGANA